MSLDLDDTSHTDNLSIFADEESKIPIHWDKNVASISGTLLSVGRALRTQHPELHHLIVTNTVEERGITYIDNPAKINLLENPKLGPEKAYTFADPCPPTETRMIQINEPLEALGLSQFSFLTAAELTVSHPKGLGAQIGQVPIL